MSADAKLVKAFLRTAALIHGAELSPGSGTDVRPSNAVFTPEFEVRVEDVVNGYADAARAFSEYLGPSYASQAPAVIAAYLHAAALVHAAELRAGAGICIAEIAAKS